MSNENSKLPKRNYKSHPWHGINPHSETPGFLNVFIEMVPSDTIKYELDKDSGFLKIDRPQKFSNIMPSLYGFIPQTYSGKATAKIAIDASGDTSLVGDEDPVDICVLTEKEVTHGDLLLTARAIGGFRMIDGGEVDDKIIAVLKDDPVYGEITDINDCPPNVISRLYHYFVTYKDIPGQAAESKCKILGTYGPEVAAEVIQASKKDYEEIYGPSVRAY